MLYIVFAYKFICISCQNQLVAVNKSVFNPFMPANLNLPMSSGPVILLKIFLELSMNLLNI